MRWEITSPEPGDRAVLLATASDELVLIANGTYDSEDGGAPHILHTTDDPVVNSYDLVSRDVLIRLEEGITRALWRHEQISLTLDLKAAISIKDAWHRIGPLPWLWMVEVRLRQLESYRNTRGMINDVARDMCGYGFVPAMASEVEMSKRRDFITKLLVTTLQITSAEWEEWNAELPF